MRQLTCIAIAALGMGLGTSGCGSYYNNLWRPERDTRTEEQQNTTTIENTTRVERRKIEPEVLPDWDPTLQIWDDVTINTRSGEPATFQGVSVAKRAGLVAITRAHAADDVVATFLMEDVSFIYVTRRTQETR